MHEAPGTTSSEAVRVPGQEHPSRGLCKPTPAQTSGSSTFLRPEEYLKAAGEKLAGLFMRTINRQCEKSRTTAGVARWSSCVPGGSHTCRLQRV
jgi:hypothetical protein